MAILTERLEIRLPRSTAAMLRVEAKRRGVPVGQIVREGIDRVLADREARMEAARRLCAMEGDVLPDWEELERQIMDAMVSGGREAKQE